MARANPRWRRSLRLTVRSVAGRRYATRETTDQRTRALGASVRLDEMHAESGDLSVRVPT